MIEETLIKLEARESIRRLVSLYCDAVSRLDPDAIGRLFTHDASVQIAGGPERLGRHEIVEGFRRTASGFSYLHQKCDMGLIDIEGDAAQARIGTLEVCRPADTDALTVICGIYEDRYSREGGRWYFHRRRFSLQSRFVLATSEVQHFGDFVPAHQFAP